MISSSLTTMAAASAFFFFMYRQARNEIIAINTIRKEMIHLNWITSRMKNSTDSNDSHDDNDADDEFDDEHTSRAFIYRLDSVSDSRRQRSSCSLKRNICNNIRNTNIPWSLSALAWLWWLSKTRKV